MVSDFTKKQKKNPLNKFILISGGVLIVIIIISLVIVNIKIYQKREKLNSQVEILKNRIEDLKNSNSNIKEGISESDNNKYIERIAREELDLQKPGEKVISFIKEDNQIEKSDEKKKSILEVWLGWLGNLTKKK